MANEAAKILGFYSSRNPGTVAGIERILYTGKLAGTGKVVALPVDQDFEHGPARSFEVNPDGYDPFYHPQLAIDAGLSFHAAPLGSIEDIARDYAAKIPLVLKVNNHDLLVSEKDPMPAQTSCVHDALRLGCVSIGYTIYPGSSQWRQMYEQLRQLAKEAHDSGLVMIVWSYPRGTSLVDSEDKKMDSAMDVVQYAARIASQLGADIIKVKPPEEKIHDSSVKKVIKEKSVPVSTLADRIRFVVKGAFDGKRMVIFSGGGKKGDDAVFEEIRGIRDGGGFGSIIGRNSFQREKPEALKFLDTVTGIYKGDVD